MNKYIRNIFISALMALPIVSCNREDNPDKGFLGVALRDGDAPLLSVVGVVSKASSPAEDQIFALDIYNGENLVASVPDYRQLTENPLELVVGTYRVVAHSGSDCGAAFDAPSYSGEATVTLRPVKLTTAEIQVTLSNVCASVNIADSITEGCSEYSVKISNGAGAELIYSSKTGTIGDMGYFTADGTLNWELRLVKPMAGEPDFEYVKSGSISNVKANRHYKFNFKENGNVSGDGFVFVEISVDNSEIAAGSGDEYTFSLNFDAADGDMISVNPWGMFAVAKAKWFAINRPEGLTFWYRKDSESVWTAVDESKVNYDESSKTFMADIPFEPLTKYFIKAATSADDAKTRVADFTTSGTPIIYNLSFDAWNKEGKVWYPYEASAAVPTWDTANKGVATFVGSTTTPVSGEGEAVRGNAARMESDVAMGKFAAGNIYIGKYGGIKGVGAYIYWGTPFVGKPVALKGYYKYNPATVNYAESKYSSMKGKMDEGEIKIILADWKDQFYICTSDNTFLEDDDSSIIAKGSLVVSGVTGEYVEFTIPIEYRDNIKIPTYVTVVATSSRYGDYFTGGTGSTLYIDEFSLEYDIATLTDEQKAKVKYR